MQPIQLSGSIYYMLLQKDARMKCYVRDMEYLVVRIFIMSYIESSSGFSIRVEIEHAKITTSFMKSKIMFLS